MFVYHLNMVFTFRITMMMLSIMVATILCLSFKFTPHNALDIIFCRYACLLPQAHILFCNTIREFGKKRDLVSALTVFEASKGKLNGPNMYLYRATIDVCGCCGNSLKSRIIFEVLA